MRKFKNKSAQLRTTLKDILKERNITYAALAQKIDVSLPTIKRWMSGDDFSVAAFECIIEELGLTMVDIGKRIEDSGVKRNPISEKQEEFLVNQPRAAFVFFLIFHNFQRKDVLRKAKINEEEFKKILFQLDKVNLLSVQNSRNYKVMARGPFAWAEGGQFSKVYFRPAAEVTFAHFLNAHQGFSKTFHPARPFARLTEMFLSEKSYTRFKADLWEIADKYREISRHEVISGTAEKLDTVTSLLFVDQFPLWETVFNAKAKK